MKTFCVIPFIIIFLASLVASDVASPQQVIPGGISSQDLPATVEIHRIIKQLHPKIQTHLLGVPGGSNIIGKLKPISYRTQLVNGINYFIKVRARTAQKFVYYNLRIYKTFDGTIRLLKVIGPVRRNDDISFF